MFLILSTSWAQEIMVYPVSDTVVIRENGIFKKLFLKDSIFTDPAYGDRFKIDQECNSITITTQDPLIYKIDCENNVIEFWIKGNETTTKKNIWFIDKGKKKMMMKDFNFSRKKIFLKTKRRS